MIGSSGSSRAAARARINLVNLCVRAAQGDEEAAGLWYVSLHNLPPGDRDQLIDVLEVEASRGLTEADRTAARERTILAELDRVLATAPRRDRDRRGRLR